ncbi:hypothetical protein [Mycobacterium sp.]|uniref:hypothetical protein n=1 Tax=Mycobacterium sp. TaxID=1785 RepID=UPI003F9869D3
MSDKPDDGGVVITGDDGSPLATGGTSDQIETIPDDTSGGWSVNDDPAGADPSAAFQDEYDDALATDGNDAFPQTDDSMPAAFAPDSDFQFVGGGWDDGGVVITGDDGSDLATGGTIDQIETIPDDTSGGWSANADPAGADPSGVFQDEYTDTSDTDGNDAFPETDDSMPDDFAPDSDFEFVGGDTTDTSDGDE